MLRISHFITLTALCLAPALAFATAPCVPTSASTEASQKAEAKYAEMISTYNAKLAQAKTKDDRLNLAGELVESVKALMHTTGNVYTEAFCVKAREAAALLFNTLKDINDSDRPAYWHLRAESIAKSWGVTLSEAHKAELNASIAATLQPALKDADVCITRKDKRCIDAAYRKLEQFEASDAGKAAGVPEKLKALEAAYRSAEENGAEHAKANVDALLASAREKLAKGDLRGAHNDVRNAIEMSRRQTPQEMSALLNEINQKSVAVRVAKAKELLAKNDHENAMDELYSARDMFRGKEVPQEITALIKEVAEKWVAAQFQLADAALAEMKDAMTDANVSKAGRALIDACVIASEYKVKTERCNK